LMPSQVKPVQTEDQAVIQGSKVMTPGQDVAEPYLVHGLDRCVASLCMLFPAWPRLQESETIRRLLNRERTQR
jgi:hypothetical protein